MAWRDSDNRKYFREYHSNRRRKATAILGGKCVACGATSALEFHHIVDAPDKKNVAKLLSVGWAEVLNELKKCVILCHKCHAEESNKRRGNRPLEHGRYGMYREKKCRCALCRAANAKYSAEHRKKYGRVPKPSRPRIYPAQCPKGHPFYGNNLVINKRGWRVFRQCHLESTRTWRAARAG